MSTQYGTISHRRTVDVPVWLIVVGLVTVAVMAGFAIERGFEKTSTSEALTVPRIVYTDSTANIREGGAVFPKAIELPAALRAVLTESTANEREGSTRYTTGGQISGGPSQLAAGNDAEGGTPAQNGIWVGDYFCHQCAS